MILTMTMMLDGKFGLIYLDHDVFVIAFFSSAPNTRIYPILSYHETDIHRHLATFKLPKVGLICPDEICIVSSPWTVVRGR